MPSKIIFREGKPEDCSLIMGKIKELSRHHGMEKIAVSEKDLVDVMSGDCQFVKCLIAETDEDQVKFVGYALHFQFFNSFLGRYLYLEDLFIEEKLRGQGYGKEFFRQLAKIGVSKGCKGIQWLTASDNTGALSFYDSLGSVNKTVKEKWQVYSLPYETLISLANSNSLLT